MNPKQLLMKFHTYIKWSIMAKIFETEIVNLKFSVFFFCRNVFSCLAEIPSIRWPQYVIVVDHVTRVLQETFPLQFGEKLKNHVKIFSSFFLILFLIPLSKFISPTPICGTQRSVEMQLLIPNREPKKPPDGLLRKKTKPAMRLESNRQSVERTKTIGDVAG